MSMAACFRLDASNTGLNIYQAHVTMQLIRQASWRLIKLLPFFLLFLICLHPPRAWGVMMWLGAEKLWLATF